MSVATTLDEVFVADMRGLPGNPYDGYTVRSALEQVEILTDQLPSWPSLTAARALTVLKRSAS